MSVDSNGWQANGNSSSPRLSSDGHYIVFESYATSLVPNDTNGVRDVFVRNLQTGQIKRVSVSSNDEQGDGESGEPSISADGRYIGFGSNASNLVSDDTNNVWDVFIHDYITGQTERVSVNSNGLQTNAPSWFTNWLSEDGRYITFQSMDGNLIPNDNNGVWDVFVRDRLMGQTECVSVNSEGVLGNSDSGPDAHGGYNSGSWGPVISPDGRFVTFRSFASNLVAGDTNAQGDIFIHDRYTGQTERISVSTDGTEGNGFCYWKSISADGRYVVFQSESSNLAPEDTNGVSDLFMRDRVTGDTIRVSVGANGEQTNGASDRGFYLTPNAHYLVFSSYANNLVSEDTNGVWDVFVLDMSFWLQ